MHCVHSQTYRLALTKLMSETVYLYLSASAKNLHGINSTFTFPSGKQSIKSPLLLWCEQRSFFKFHYQLSLQNSLLSIRKDVMCYKDLRGLSLIKEWSDNIDLGIRSGRTFGTTKCVKLIDTDRKNNRCKSFRVKITISVEDGVLIISNLQFGGESLCKQQPPKVTKVDCSFENGDCGLENDACGVVDWEVRNDYDDETSSHDKRSISCYSQKGVPLLKKQIRDSCSFEHLAIVKLQRSGFTMVDIQSEVGEAVDEIKSKVLGRKQRSYGYSLYLDPTLVSGVAIGVVDLPEVEHDSSNAFLRFYHDMVEGGLHDLIVTAVCTSDPSNSLIPLDYAGVHYHKSNFYGIGSSGLICLDIHEYVVKKKCSKFVIQMQAAAIETSVIIDNIYFFENLRVKLW